MNDLREFVEDLRTNERVVVRRTEEGIYLLTIQIGYTEVETEGATLEEAVARLVEIGGSALTTKKRATCATEDFERMLEDMKPGSGMTIRREGSGDYHVVWEGVVTMMGTGRTFNDVMHSMVARRIDQLKAAEEAME